MRKADWLSLGMYAIFLMMCFYVYKDTFDGIAFDTDDRVTAFEAKLEGKYQEAIQKLVKVEDKSDT